MNILTQIPTQPNLVSNFVLTIVSDEYCEIKARTLERIRRKKKRILM